MGKAVYAQKRVTDLALLHFVDVPDPFPLTFALRAVPILCFLLLLKSQRQHGKESGSSRRQEASFCLAVSGTQNTAWGLKLVLRSLDLLAFLRLVLMNS